MGGLYKIRYPVSTEIATKWAWIRDTPFVSPLPFRAFPVSWSYNSFFWILIENVYTQPILNHTIINPKLLQMSVHFNISHSEGMRRCLCWIKVTFLNVWECSQYFGLRALVMSLSHSGATCALQFDTLLTAHYCLSNTKAKGQLLFVTMFILCFFLAYSSDKGIVFLITKPLSKVRKRDKS